MLTGRRVCIGRLRLVVAGRLLLARLRLVARVLAYLRVVAEHAGHLVMAGGRLLRHCLVVVVGRVAVLVVVRVGVVVRDGAHVRHGRGRHRVMLSRCGHGRRLVVGGLVRVPDWFVGLVPGGAVVVASVEDAQGVVDAGAVLGGCGQRGGCGVACSGRRRRRASGRRGHSRAGDRDRARARAGGAACHRAAHLNCARAALLIAWRTHHARSAVGARRERARRARRGRRILLRSQMSQHSVDRGDLRGLYAVRVLFSLND